MFLMASTVFSTASHHFCPCFSIYSYFFFSSLPSPNPPISLPVIICLLQPCSTSSVGRLWQHSRPLLSHSSLPPRAIFYSHFILTSLTNIPMISPSSAPSPCHPFILSFAALSPANRRSFPPLDVARYCGCEERCSDSEMCHSAES